MSVAAGKDDTVIEVGCLPCNLTSMDNTTILCTPPTERPVCKETPDVQGRFPVVVS